MNKKKKKKMAEVPVIPIHAIGLKIWEIIMTIFGGKLFLSTPQGTDLHKTCRGSCFFNAAKFFLQNVNIFTVNI